MALVEVARFYNSLDAGLARSRLAEDGIESVLFDMEMSWEGMGGIIPIRPFLCPLDILSTRCHTFPITISGPDRPFPQKDNTSWAPPRTRATRLARRE